MSDHGFQIDDLDAVLLSGGPGSYTGLRIAASGIKGLLFNSSATLYSVNTLASFAVSAMTNDSGCTTIHSVIDARRTHLYHQSYSIEAGLLKKKNNLEVKEISDVEDLISQGDCIVGTGITRLRDDIISGTKVFDSDYISAKSLVRLYEIQPDSDFINKTTVEEFEPDYYTSNQINNSNAK